MKAAAKIAGMLVGITGLALIVLGLFFWSGTALTLIPLHMALGFVFVLAMWTLCVAGARRFPVRSGLTFAWSLVVPALGMTQMQLLPGPYHWVIRFAHLLVGLIAMRLARDLAIQILRGPSAESSEPQRVEAA